MSRFQRGGRQRHRVEDTLARCQDPRFLRRLLALRQVDQGLAVVQVAQLLGASRQSVHHWLRVYRHTGRLDRLAGQSRPGRPSFWDEGLGKALEELLAQSPQALGYFAGDWTVPLLAEHLRQARGREPSGSTLRRRLHALGYTWKRSRYVLDPDPELEKKCRILR